MKKTLMTFRMRLMAVIAVVLAVGGLVTLLPLVAGSVEPREILVVARQMSFYVGDGQTENPTIQVRPGERIRITLVNRDPGFDPQLRRPGVGCQHAGASATAAIPSSCRCLIHPGATTYVCSRHSSMMKGTIEVIRARHRRLAGALTPSPSAGPFHREQKRVDTALCHDCRPLRFHYRHPFIRPGSAMVEVSCS